MDDFLKGYTTKWRYALSLEFSYLIFGSTSCQTSTTLACFENFYAPASGNLFKDSTRRFLIESSL
jgi:hypothetical protein